MPASLGTVPAALVPPFGAVPPPSAAAPYSPGASLRDSLEVRDGRINYVLNPSFETDLGSWAIYGGVSDIRRDTTQKLSGSASCYVIANRTGANNGIVSRVQVPPGGGQMYTVSAYVRNDVGSRGWYILFTSYNGSTALVPSNSATVTPASGQWARISATFTLPQNADNMLIYVAQSTTGSIGDSGWVDGVMLERGYGGAWFDGDTSGAAWAGNKTPSVSGNLLTANEASFETDVSAWLGASNCTIASTSADAAVGSKSMLVTTTATTAFNFRTTRIIPVTEGIDYTVVASVKQGTGARNTASVGVLWVFGSKAPFGVAGGDSMYISTTEWRRMSTVQRAPVGATGAYVYVVVSSTGAVGDTMYVDAVGMWEGAGGDWVAPGAGAITNLGRGLSISHGPPPGTTRINLAKSPSLEASGSAAANGAGFSVAADTTTSYLGTQSYKGTVTTLGSVPSIYAVPAVITTASSYSIINAGSAYTSSAYVKADRAGMRAQVYNAFRDANNVVVGTSYGPLVNISDTSWTRVSYTITPPANATSMFSAYFLNDPSGTYPVGLAYWVDAVLVEPSSTLGSWFDGNTSGAAWAGTTDGSVSVLSTAPYGASVALGRTPSDAVVISDTVSTVFTPGNVALSRSIAETLTITEALNYPGARLRSAADTLTATDSAARTVTLKSAAADNLAAADTANAQSALGRSAADAAAVADTVTRRLERAAAAADAVAVADALTRAVSRLATATDTLTAAVTATITRNYHSAAADTVQLAHTATFDLILATPKPVHAAGTGAGMAVAGTTGASAAAGSPGRAEGRGAATTVYASGSSNQVEAS